MVATRSRLPDLLGMELPIDPAAPCPCPSGLPYGECHKPIIEAADAELLDVSHREYARRWEGNSSAYEAQGIYHWLTDHLARFGPVRRVIDVGCGRGQGLAALREMTGGEGLLVGVDENPDCLAAAAERLGVTRPARRLVRKTALGRTFDVQPLLGLLPARSPVMLIQADMLLPDPEFEGWAMTLPLVDAVTMWFTGVHPARQHDRLMHSLAITDDTVHRMANDLATLELAGALLPPSGLLHIAGRGMASDRRWLVGETTESMRALAEHGPFDVINVELREYEEPTSGPRFAVGARGASGYQHYVTSTILQRRS